MLIRKNSKLEDLKQALHLKYGDARSDIDFEEKITYSQEGRQELWSLRLLGTDIEAACLLSGQKVNDFHCNCDQFSLKKHCGHLSRLVDLASKKLDQKLHPTIKRQRYKSLRDDVEFILMHAQPKDLTDFLHRQAKSFDDFGLLLITAHLQYSKDINEDSHWIRLKSLFNQAKITLKKEANLLRHLQEIKRQLDELIRAGDVKEASSFYMAFSRHLLLDVFKFSSRDPKTDQIKEWFERYPSALIHFKMAPVLQSVLKECIGDLLFDHHYLLRSQLLLFQLPSNWLPEKSMLASGLKNAVIREPRLLESPGIYFLYGIFCGLPSQVSLPKDESNIKYWSDMCRYMDPIYEANEILFTLILENNNSCLGMSAYLSNYNVGFTRIGTFASFLEKSSCTDVLSKLNTDDQGLLRDYLIREGKAKVLYQLCRFFKWEASCSWMIKSEPDHWFYLYPVLSELESNITFDELTLAIHEYLDHYLGESNQHRIFQFFERLLTHNKVTHAIALLQDIESTYPDKKSLTLSVKSLSAFKSAIASGIKN
jgi:hypothetical protein